MNSSRCTNGLFRALRKPKLTVAISDCRSVEDAAGGSLARDRMLVM
jgi:hypothetical protein